MLIAVMLTSVAVVMLLDAHRRENRSRQLAAKTIASSVFVVFGAVSWSAGSPIATWLLVGLFLGALGDFLLQLDGCFDAGLAAFLTGHLAYIFAFSRVLPIDRWSPWVAGLATVFMIAALRWLWSHLGARRIPVTIYALVISAMVTAACSAAATHAVPVFTAAGAVLFYVSDLGVARQRFVCPSLGNRVFSLPLYYAGQLLLAWTISAV